MENMKGKVLKTQVQGWDKDKQKQSKQERLRVCTQHQVWRHNDGSTHRVDLIP